MCTEAVTCVHGVSVPQTYAHDADVLHELYIKNSEPLLADHVFNTVVPVLLEFRR